MPYTPPDVIRVNTKRGTTRVVELGFISQDGTYRFRDGRTIKAGKGLTLPDGTNQGGNAKVIVQPDGQLRYGPGEQDGIDPAGTATRGKHHVDASAQAVYDAAPDSFTSNYLAVFTAADA